MLDKSIPASIASFRPFCSRSSFSRLATARDLTGAAIVSDTALWFAVTLPAWSPP